MGRLNLSASSHQAESLPVALGFRHAEIAVQLGLRVAAFLLPDDHDGPSLEEGEAADNRGIVGEGAVAVKLAEIRKEALDVIERVRALGMARELNALPGGVRYCDGLVFVGH